MKRYSDYDDFAWLYTNYWGDEFHRQALPVLEKLVLRRLPPQAAVLDLCCGDGRISQKLRKRGFEVTGLDGSEQMLSYAKQRIPAGRFLLRDARSFELPAIFDAVISTFDSLNHVLGLEDLAAVFRNVYAALKEGGRFAFDLNREEAYRDFWARASTDIRPKVVSIVRGSYDEDLKLADCRITLFRLEGAEWRRSDFKLSQRCHDPAAVVRTLEEAGFTVEVLDGKADLGMDGDIGEGRNFYLAQKH